MFRAVKIGGGIIVTVPHHRFLWSSIDEYSFHRRRYTRKELIDKIGLVGFEVIWVTSFVFFLLPFMFLSRLRFPISKRNFDPLAEIKINPLLNTVFEKAMNSECFLIQSGISLPAGGSLLMVAKRSAR
jgi:hypothetical protein